MILGITGNIAAGKSSVATWLAEYGYPLVSADRLAREVVAPGSPVLRQLTQRFGAEVLNADGSLNRQKLAAEVFANPEARRELEALTHPAIARLAVERLEALREAGHELILYEAPLLFEAGAEGRVDKVLVVTIDPQIQLQRLMDRDGFTRHQAEQRISAQMPQAQKMARADFLIDNSGTPESCRRQIRELLRKLGLAPPESPDNP